MTEGMTVTGLPLPAATSLQPPPILKFRPGRPPPRHLNALPFHTLPDFPISITDILFHLRTLKHIRNTSDWHLRIHFVDISISASHNCSSIPLQHTACRKKEVWVRKSQELRLKSAVILSLGALRTLTSSWRPFGPLDFVLRAPSAATF